jgi:hypothetical protein
LIWHRFRTGKVCNPRLREDMLFVKALRPADLRNRKVFA